jgi:hypothetical protein
MTTIRWAGGISLAVILGVTGAPGSESEAAELPIPAPAKPAAKPVRALHRTCVGTDGKPFAWDSPNVPFAAVCTFDEDGPAQPTPPRPSK